MNALTLGATIIVEKTGREYHTLEDWGLAIGNNNYISEPIVQTSYIVVPGSNVLVDVSEALTGRPTFERRAINIEVGGIDKRLDWDSTISKLRNAIEGKVVHVIFDNDTAHYWRGRAHIVGYDRFRSLGTFTISLPDADPYKYDVLSNLEPWLWDPFDFENDNVPEEPIINVNGTANREIAKGTMPTCPSFTVTEMTEQLYLKFKGKEYTLANGYNYFPAVMVNGDDNVTLEFRGRGQVVMEYRGGSL